MTAKHKKPAKAPARAKAKAKPAAKHAVKKPLLKAAAKKPEPKATKSAAPIVKKAPVLFQKKQVSTPPAPPPPVVPAKADPKAVVKKPTLDLKLDEPKPEEDKTEAP